MNATSSAPPYRILFVCSGNICRSPLAEGIFRELARARGLALRFEVDSAGTHGLHAGEPADPRARAVGQRHGVPVTSIARAVEAGDFHRFDLIVAMDRGHLRDLRRQCPEGLRGRLRLMREFDHAGAPLDVPDPYYGALDGFEDVYDMLTVSCRRLLDALARGEDLAVGTPVGTR
jgi:protein-tyrosine phosphatase